VLVVVNGEPRAVVEQTSLEDLLVTLALPRERVAVELNQKVVRRVDWPASTLREGDKIEIVHFVGGGGEERSETGRRGEGATSTATNGNSELSTKN